MIKTVLFDWNGTLLDDVASSVKAMNVLLQRRGLQQIESLKIYRELFGFPVFNYYQKLGFDFSQESFERVSEEFMCEYDRFFSDCQLVKGSRQLIENLHKKEISCCILTASKQENCILQLKKFGIDCWFDEIIGIENIYAASKLEAALCWQRQSSRKPEEMVLIGDTMHDAEVAKKMKVRCFLVADGHQSFQQLSQTGFEVVDHLNELDFKRLVL